MILRSLREDIKEEDALLLNEWIEFSNENSEFFGQFANQDALLSKLTSFRKADSASIWHRTLEKISENPAATPWQKTRKESFLFRRWKYVAAGGMVLLLAGSVYLFLRPAAPLQQGLIKADRPVIVSSGATVLPGSNRATLTLADGSIVIPDKLKNGLLAEQGGIRIEKTAEGELSYTPVQAAHPSGSAGDNILSTPRGGQYKVILPDGTRVWLNAVSSLKYPAAFGDRERRVELRGEAYFEVATHPIPFKVSLHPIRGNPGDRRPENFVEVLGTHFNIMDYDDEPASRTTLFEGSIMINAGRIPVTIKPGQQAIVADSESNVLVIRAPGNVNAWVDGSIQFDGQDLPAIMRELSRWYDVDVEYAGKIPPFRLDGSISRSTSIEDLLKILNVQGGRELEFRMEGKKIFVTGKLKS